MKVLIAEDDLVTRTLMMRATLHAGHEGTSAADGREMLALYEQFRPDVALVDWRMPSLDGVEAIQEMRRLPGGKDVFVVIVTGVEGETETARALEAGIDDYLLKPISAPRLRLILRLAEVRLSRRRSQSGDTPRRFNADEALRHFGFVAGADGEGRLLFVHNGPAGANSLARPGEGIHRLFGTDGDTFGDAVVEATETGRSVRFSTKQGAMAGVELMVKGIRKDGRVTGYLVGEAQRMSDENVPQELLRRATGSEG